MQLVPRRDERLVSGTDVEVRTNYEGHWTAGFQVAGMVEGRYVLRRTSDRTVLPVTFGADDLRRATRI